MQAYKLMRIRKDGTLGSLFINRRAKLPLNVWLDAEEHETKGYAYRPGWHVLKNRKAPHLSKKGRVWVKVQIKEYKKYKVPTSQGGIWYLAKKMKIISIEE